MKTKIVWIVWMLILAGLTAFAGEKAAPMGLYGYWGEPGYNQVLVNGRYAYLLSHSAGLTIADVSDVYHPKVKGRFRLFMRYGCMALSGKRLFVNVDAEKILALDVTNPSKPSLLGTFAGPFARTDIRVKGNYLYISQGYEGLFIIDISNPSQMKKAAVLKSLNTTSVQFFGDYGFAGGFRKLLLMDFSKPLEPREIKSWPLKGWSGEVLISGNRAVIPHSWEDSDSSMGEVVTEYWLMDIQDIKNPRLLGATGMLRSAGKAVYTGGMLYVSYLLMDKLEVYGIADNGSFQRLDALSGVKEGWRYVDLNHDGRALYGVNDTHGLRVLSLYQSSPVSIVGRLAGTGTLRNVQADGSHLYVAGGATGLYDVDISSPNRPRTVGFSGDSDEEYLHSAFYKGYVYLLDDMGRLTVMDCRFPETPTPVYNLPEVSYLSGLAIYGEYLLAASADLLYVMDLKKPERPAIISRYDIFGIGPMCFSSLTVLNAQLLYLQCDNSIVTLSLRNPVSPEYQGFSADRFGTSLKAAGKFLFSQDSWGSLVVLDPSDLPSVKVLAVYPEFRYELSGTNDRYVFLYHPDKGLRAYDFSDPLHPVEVRKAMLTDSSGAAPGAVEVRSSGDWVVCIFPYHQMLRVLSLTGDNVPPAEIGVDTTKLCFRSPAAEGERVEPQYISVFNKTGGEFHWSVEADEPVSWLFRVSPRSGAGNGRIEATPRTGALRLQTGYIGDIIIKSPESAEEDIRVKVEIIRE